MSVCERVSVCECECECECESERGTSANVHVHVYEQRVLSDGSLSVTMMMPEAMAKVMEMWYFSMVQSKVPFAAMEYKK